MTHKFIYKNTEQLVEALKKTLNELIIKFSDKEYSQLLSDLCDKDLSNIYQSILNKITKLYHHARHDLDGLFDNATSDEERVAKGVFNNQIVKSYVLHVQNLLIKSLDTKQQIYFNDSYIAQQIKTLRLATEATLELSLENENPNPIIDTETIITALAIWQKRYNGTDEMQEIIEELIQQEDPGYDDTTLETKQNNKLIDTTNSTRGTSCIIL